MLFDHVIFWFFGHIFFIVTILPSEGSYLCTCLAGYEMDENTCIDINECDLTNSCGKNAECVNSVGSFECVCNPGLKIQLEI